VTDNPEKSNLVWGGEEIFRALRMRNRKAAYNALEAGEIDGACKVNGRWCLDLDLNRAGRAARAERQAREARERRKATEAA
jgi:hypothetical protein